MNVFQLLKSIQKKSKKYSTRVNNFAAKIIKTKRALFVAVVAILILASSAFADFLVKNNTRALNIIPSSFLSLKPALYPKVSDVLGLAVADDNQDPSLSAQSAVVMDDASKRVLYSKNGGFRFSMASTTKIMTALTALEHYQLSDVLTVQSPAEGSLVGFHVGEEVRFLDLLYGMMLPSGNDAALAIAQNYPGGYSAFVAKMNENATLLHLENTHYADPTGLDDNGDYTTPVDLARLASKALENKTLAEIVSTKERVISDVSAEHIYRLHNLNALLGTEGVNGIKTGFTDEAGGVLVTSKVQDGHTLIIVVMKSDDRFADTKELLSWVSHVKYLNVAR